MPLLAAIARALAIDPEIYLFDEPTAHLDREHVPLVESLLLGFARRGRTVVLTTHNLEQAQRLTSRMVALRDGVAEAIEPAVAPR